MQFWLILPWILVVLGTAVFAAVLRRQRAALADTGATLERIRQAVESASDAIGIGDFEGNSLYHNRSHVALFGYTVEELNAAPGQGVLFADKAVARAIIARVFEGKSWAGETDILTKDGRRVPALVRADVIRDSAGKPVGIFGVFRDVTRERKLAEEAERAAKLDSIGMLASGIAHDFNNLITVVSAYSGLALTEPGLTDAVRGHLEEINKVADRARDLTSQIKAFARGEAPAKRLVALPRIVREATHLAVQDGAVELRCEIPDDLPAVMADAGQIHQVVNNLALNAVQAMPKGGRLSVAADTIEPAQAAACSLDEGRWVRVTVADTGSGIPPENLAKIFEPFFTTKKTGTGLGLATCFSIVAKHGGHLRVESTVGVGTTFQILLPAAGLSLVEADQAEPALAAATCATH